MTINGFELDQNTNRDGSYFGYINGWFVDYAIDANGELEADLTPDYGDGKSENPMDYDAARAIVAAGMASAPQRLRDKIAASLA